MNNDIAGSALAPEGASADGARATGGGMCAAIGTNPSRSTADDARAAGDARAADGGTRQDATAPDTRAASPLDLAHKLAREHTLTDDEYRVLICERTPESAERLAELARAAREPIYGTRVFTRGLIEISNICRNDCLYCGIRRSNRNATRYRLEPDVIVACAREGYELGFRTIVLQAGEDAYYTDEVLARLVERIVAACPETAVTLSMGERSRESYRRLPSTTKSSIPPR